MALHSSLSWIDFSEQDRRKMVEVISLFKHRDTRDELGLGSIRDAFANLFFPGTSTLQTRARYYLFVPWLYRYYESRHVRSERVGRRIRRDEVKLIQTLKAANERGIIGQRSGTSLHRFPSSIYWNGLRRWKILRFVGSQGQYHRWLDTHYRQQREQRTLMTEFEGGAVDFGNVNWDPSLPDMLDGFPDSADFNLTKVEASYLRERLMLSCPDSLLATLVDRCTSVENVDLAWQHPQLGEFPTKQQDQLLHAQYFSECMLGAVLLYNLMLAERRGDDDLIEDYRSLTDMFEQALLTEATYLAEWDRSAFWRLVTDHGRVAQLTRHFVNEWLDLLLEHRERGGLADGQDARKLVRDREWRLKRGRSRFESRRHLEMWSGAAGVFQMNFRWNIARRITNDILEGLGSNATT